MSSSFIWAQTICPFQESLGIICVPSDASDPAHLIRNPGKDPMYKTLPTAEDVEDTAATPLFDTLPFDTTSRNSFRNKLEGGLNCQIYNLLLRTGDFNFTSLSPEFQQCVICASKNSET